MYLVSKDLSGFVYGYRFLLSTIDKKQNLTIRQTTMFDEPFVRRMISACKQNIELLGWEFGQFSILKWLGPPRYTPIEWKSTISCPSDELFGLMSGIESGEPNRIHYIIYFAGHNTETMKEPGMGANVWSGDTRIEVLGGQYAEVIGDNEQFCFILLSQCPLDRWFSMGATPKDNMLLRTRITLAEFFVHEFDHMTRAAFELHDRDIAERSANSAINALRRYQGRNTLINEKMLRYDIYPNGWSARRESSIPFKLACGKIYQEYLIPMWDSPAFPGVDYLSGRLPPPTFCPVCWLGAERAWRSWEVALQVAGMR